MSSFRQVGGEGEAEALPPSSQAEPQAGKPLSGHLVHTHGVDVGLKPSTTPLSSQAKELAHKVTKESADFSLTPPTSASSTEAVVVVKLPVEAKKLEAAINSGNLEEIKKMQAEGRDLLSWQKEDGRTALHLAAKAGKTSICQFFLELGMAHGVSLIDKRDKNGMAPLELALTTSTGSGLACASLLLDAQADVSEKTSRGISFLALASGCANLEVLNKIKERLGPDFQEALNKPDSEGATPLIHAARSKDARTSSRVQMLLESRANANVRDAAGNTPLMLVYKTGNFALAKELVEKGASVNVQDPQTGKTPLIQAAFEGKDAQYNFFLQHGASVTSQTKEGITALHYAAGGDDPEFIEALIKKGADVNAQTVNGLTPLEAAVANGSSANVPLLLASGADIDRRNNEGKTALHIAVEKGYNEIASLLIKSGASIRIADREDNTALHRAVEWGDQVLFAALKTKLEASDFVLVNDSGKTPLILAAEKGNLAACQLLVEMGGKEGVVRSDKNGNTALLAACAEGRQEVVEYFLSLRSPEFQIDLEQKNAAGESLLQLAQGRDLMPIIKILLQPELRIALTRPTRLDFERAVEVSMVEQRPIGVVLKERGFQATISGIELPRDGFDIDFSGLTFEGCAFAAGNFSRSVFHNATFIDCLMEEVIFAGSNFKDCKLQGCKLQDSLFEKAKLVNCSFEGCKMPYSGIISSDLLNVTFTDCDLSCANFLQSTASGCAINKSTLANCYLYETQKQFSLDEQSKKTHEITQPAVFIAWYTEKPGEFAIKTVASLKQAKAVPIKIDYLPQGIVPNELDSEVRDCFKVLDSKKVDPKDTRSYAERLLDLAENEPPRPLPQLKAMLEHADYLARNMDALLLPGGDDIPPEFYQQKKEDVTKPDSDYRRTVFELAVLKYVKRRGVPLMGICRGSQISNVFFGGTLNQDAGSQQGLQTLERTASKPEEGIGVVRGILYGKDVRVEAQTPAGAEPGSKQELVVNWPQNNVQGEMHHHQASKTVGRELAAIAENNKMIKAMERVFGAMGIFTQFHPEGKQDMSQAALKRNNAFFTAIRQAGWEHHAKKEAAELIKKDPKRAP